MTQFNEATASAAELWDHCMAEYQSRNPIIVTLLDRFYTCIGRALANVPANGTILEVGCGAGESTRRIVPMLRGQTYEASEYDHRYVEMLKKHGFVVPVRQESVYELDRKDGSYDCVVMLEVLEHLEDVEKALSELFRVSKRFVLLSVPNEPLWCALNFARGKYWGSLGNTPGHINHWSSRGLKKLMQKYGKVVATYTPLPWTIVLVEKSSSNDGR